MNKRNLKDEIMVSICCITYNQKEYLRYAIDSFLMQKTTFKYEIIIHDDCSNDGTIELLKEYEKKYPDVIRVLYNNFNKYSKGEKLLPYVFNVAQGKYVAVCEGDDYWCDENKLQTQYDFLEKNADCSLVTHNNYFHDDTIGKLIKRHMFNKDKYLSTDEIILRGGGIVATNSMFFRRKDIISLPDFYFVNTVEDYPLLIHLSLCGKVYYMNKIMSVYRINCSNSWSSRIRKRNSLEMINKKINWLNKNNEMLDMVNKLTDYKYRVSIDKTILLKKYIIALTKRDYKEIRKKEFFQLYSLWKYKGYKFVIKLFLMRNFGWLYNLYEKMIKGH